MSCDSCLDAFIVWCASCPCSGIVSYFVFVLSYNYNKFLHWLFPERRRWYDRIDEVVILGALPEENIINDLHYTENVCGVLNMTSINRRLKAYKRLNIEYLQIQVIDFTSPNLQQLVQGVWFVEKMSKIHKSVYLHCKAGRGRSTTVAVCWVMYNQGISAKEAQKIVTAKRPHVSVVCERKAVLEFEKAMNESRLSELFAEYCASETSPLLDGAFSVACN